MLLVNQNDEYLMAMLCHIAEIKESGNYYMMTAAQNLYLRYRLEKQQKVSVYATIYFMDLDTKEIEIAFKDWAKMPHENTEVFIQSVEGAMRAARKVYFVDSVGTYWVEYYVRPRKESLNEKIG